jgi:hypothetical protein
VRIGITGHQRLADPSDWDWVRGEIALILDGARGPLVGISSLAAGADQLFASLILSHGGSLEVVVPFEGYAEGFAEERDAHTFVRLLRRASRVEPLRRRGKSDEEAYMEAGRHLVDACEMLVAVWDGRPASGLGGTADVVSYALGRKKMVVHLNPLTRGVETV